MNRDYHATFAELREIVRRGGKVPQLADCMRDVYGIKNSLGFLICLVEAFDVFLGDIIHIKGATCFGGEIYDDDTINSMVMPSIMEAQPRWEGKQPVIYTGPKMIKISHND